MVAVLAVTLGVSMEASSPAGDPTSFMYTVKFTCVNEVGPATVVGVEGPFEPAAYRTAVNLHNPQGFPVDFTKKAVIARGQGLRRGQISKKVKETLLPDEALAVNCVNISELLKGPGQLGDQPVGDGFVIIESDVELDVVAVYTQLFIDHEIAGLKNIVLQGPIADLPASEDFPIVFEVDPESGMAEPRRYQGRDRPGDPTGAPSGKPGNPELPIVSTRVEAGKARILGAGLGIGLGVGVGSSIDVEYVEPKLVRKGRVSSIGVSS